LPFAQKAISNTNNYFVFLNRTHVKTSSQVRTVNLTIEKKIDDTVFI